MTATVDQGRVPTACELEAMRAWLEANTRRGNTVVRVRRCDVEHTLWWINHDYPGGVGAFLAEASQ